MVLIVGYGGILVGYGGGSFCSGCLWVVLVCFALRVVVVLMVDLMLMLVFMIGVLRWVSV